MAIMLKSIAASRLCRYSTGAGAEVQVGGGWGKGGKKRERELEGEILAVGS